MADAILAYNEALMTIVVFGLVVIFAAGIVSLFVRPHDGR